MKSNNKQHKFFWIIAYIILFIFLKNIYNNDKKYEQSKILFSLYFGISLISSLIIENKLFDDTDLKDDKKKLKKFYLDQ